MSHIVLTKEYSSPKMNKREIMRYMGVVNCSNDIDNLIESCLTECLPVLRYSVCYTETEIKTTNNGIVSFAGSDFYSSALLHNLNGCCKAIVFSATIGIGIDRLITRYSRISPSKAFCFQAIGTERIEALCNCFNEEVAKEFGKTRQRFSPGYGDFDISAQRDIFLLLNSSKNIGLTLNDSLIMSPSKSVTAIIGIDRKD